MPGESPFGVYGLVEVSVAGSYTARACRLQQLHLVAQLRT